MIRKSPHRPLIITCKGQKQTVIIHWRNQATFWPINGTRREILKSCTCRGDIWRKIQGHPWGTLAKSYVVNGVNVVRRKYHKNELLTVLLMKRWGCKYTLQKYHCYKRKERPWKCFWLYEIRNHDRYLTLDGILNGGVGWRQLCYHRLY